RTASTTGLELGLRRRGLARAPAPAALFAGGGDLGYRAADAKGLSPCEATAGRDCCRAPQEAIGGTDPACFGRADHAAPDRVRVGQQPRGPDRRARARDPFAARRAAAAAGGRAAGLDSAAAPGGAGTVDRGRLPRRGRRRARAATGR